MVEWSLVLPVSVGMLRGGVVNGALLDNIRERLLVFRQEPVELCKLYEYSGRLLHNQAIMGRDQVP